MIKTMTVMLDLDLLASGDTSKPFVNFKCDEMPLPFWQMVIDEVARQLKDMRQANAAMALRNKMIEDAQNASIAALLSGKNPTSKFGPG